MAERRGPAMTDPELEATLRDVGARLAYPAAADLLPAVRQRLQRGGGLWWQLWSPRAFAPALVALAVLLVATLALQPIGAQALEALRIRGILIFRTTETLPPATPRPSPSASASLPPGGVLADASRVASVDLASELVGFTVIVPSALGAPDEVYVRVGGQDAQAFLVYLPRAGVPASGQTGIGVLVTEVRGTFEVGILGKVLGSGSKATELTVNGSPGVWIEGAPHQFFYRQPNGNFVPDTLRLAGNVLVWNRGDVLIRIEADVSKDDALRIASSMR